MTRSQWCVPLSLSAGTAEAPRGMGGQFMGGEEETRVSTGCGDQKSFIPYLMCSDSLRQQTQMESIWNADLSSSSYPIMEKTSLNTLWAQLGGYPDIPKLLQFDIQWTFRKALASLQSQ